MRLLGKVAIGGGLASAATATCLVAAGVFATSATLVVLDPAAPRAAAGPKALTPFDSCAELLDWYVDNEIGNVGPYGWDDVSLAFGYEQLALRDMSSAATGAVAPVASSPTGTNTQEGAVDEPDVAKSNGSLVVRVVDDNRLVVVDVTGSEPRVAARLDLPRRGYESELLLVGDHALVTQQVYQPAPRRGAGARTASSRIIGFPGVQVTRILDVDLTDPARPELRSSDRITGRLLSARQYGETVRLVTTTDRPNLDWVQPSKRVSRREATQQNRELLRQTSIEQWLPSVERDGSSAPLVECRDVYHPKAYAGAGTTTVTTLPADGGSARSSTGLTAGAGVVYSSADRLYLATSDFGISTSRFDAAEPTDGYQDARTSLHAFALTGGSTPYVGSGEVRGFLRDRWSLDENDADLRVAWTRTGPRGQTRNGITVLTERNGDLVVTGEIGDLGVEEDLQSVRWFDDLAVLVTFRQIDPLYTVDLSDPTRPRLLGALKIPGYSGYLHPIGENLLLGLGMDGNARGLTTGAQAAVFDISDPADPIQVSKVAFRGNTYLPALDDPRSFTWLPTSSAAITPLSSWSTGDARMLRLEVSADGTLSATTLADLNREWQARSFALPDGRVAVLDLHRVRTFAG